MEVIKFENIDNFNSAQAAIETAKDSLTLVVKKVKSTSDPDLTKPYTKYDKSTLSIRADEFILKTLLNGGYEFTKVQSYEEWSKRFDAVASLKKLVAESPISVDLGGGKVVPLQSMIEEWYTSKTKQVSSFMETGDSAFLKSIETSEDSWWDADGSNGTVREQAVAIVEPLVS